MWKSIKSPTNWLSKTTFCMYFTGYILEPGIPTHHCVIHSDIDCIAISRTVRLISHGYFAMETYDANPSMIIYEYFFCQFFATWMRVIY